MKMYAKNQEVAACLPAAEKLKHFRLRDGRRKRTLDTPVGETEAASTATTELHVNLFISSVRCVFRSFFSTRENREKIAPTANDEECVKGKWKIHEQRSVYLKKKPLTHRKNRDEKCILPKCSSDIYNVLIALKEKKKLGRKSRNFRKSFDYAIVTILSSRYYKLFVLLIVKFSY